MKRPDGSQEFVEAKATPGDGSGVEFRVKAKADGAVSYTHLTLPTSDLV